MTPAIVSDPGWVGATPVLLVGVALIILAVVFALVVWRHRVRRKDNSRRDLPGQSAWVTQPVTPPPAASGGPRTLLGLDEPDPWQSGRSGGRSVGMVALAVAAVAILGAAGWLLTSRTGASGADEGVWRQAPRTDRVDFVRSPSGSRSGGNAAMGTGAGEDAEASAASRMTAVDPERGMRLIAWSGSGQVGEPGRPLRRALAVVVRDSADRPIPGVEVHFAVPEGGGRLEPSTVVTSDLGLAATTWWLGADPNALRVTAYLAEPPGLRVEFGAMIDADAELPEPVFAEAASPQAEAAETASQPAESEARTAPAAAAAPASVAIQTRAAFSAGGVQTCMVAAREGAVCWGGDDGGSGRRAVPDGAPSLRAVSAGVFHACGLTGRGTVYCWPLRGGGQSGLAAPGAELELQGDAVPVEVVAGSEHSCALTSDGAVYCWGTNAHGQLGNGAVTESASPVRVEGLPAVNQLASGWGHTCGLTASGRAYCWGANGRGQIGDGSSNDRARATAVDHTDHFTRLTAGSAHTCGMTRAGAVLCWGNNEHGQLGTGSGASQPRPRRVAGEHVFRTVTAGGVHTCALTGTGSAWCWGRNTFGQLGDGTSRDRALPAAVAGDLRFVALEAGGAHTCGESEGGRVYCWGNNVQGQLGDGTRENRSTPVPGMQERRP